MLPSGLENPVLANLAATEAASLDWEQIELAQGPVPDGDARQYVYFPCAGLIGLRQDGPSRWIQVALVGHRGSSSLHLSRALGAFVIVQGNGWRVPRATLSRAARQSAVVDHVLVADNDNLLEQVVQHLRSAQLALIPQRVAGWLCLAAEQSDLDAFDITHEDLAGFLAIRRSGVTTAMHLLEGEGAVRSGRGHILIKDRHVLEQLAAIGEGRRGVAPPADRLEAAELVPGRVRYGE